VDPTLDLWITVGAAGGIVAGLWLLGRGLIEYRATVRVGDTSTSTITSLAAGEVRISGVVEPAEMTLVSLLQSVPCVYYRATIGRGGEVSPIEDGFVEERSCGFRVRDETGSIRVFPNHPGYRSGRAARRGSASPTGRPRSPSSSRSATLGRPTDRWRSTTANDVAPIERRGSSQATR
jgi:hypothetical protein